MKLTILGSGAALPSKTRSQPAHLLKIKDNLVLLDCGPGTLRQFTKIKKDYFNLTHIFITHTHADHVSELWAIIEAIFVRNLTAQTRTEPLKIIGPPKFKKFFENVKEHLIPEKMSYPIEVYEMGNDKKDFGNFEVESKITRHVEFFESLAYKITRKDDSFVYSGDTSFCPEIIEISKGANTLLIESTLPIKEEFPKGHLNPQFAAEIAELSGVKKLILTHLYDLDSLEKIKDEVLKRFKGKVIIARDLQEIEV